MLLLKTKVIYLELKNLFVSVTFKVPTNMIICVIFVGKSYIGIDIGYLNKYNTWIRIGFIMLYV